MASGELIQEGNLRLAFNGRIAPKKLPRKVAAPVTMQVSGAIRTADGGKPPELRKIAIAFNRFGQVSTKGLPSCDPGQIEQTTSEGALEACGDALVGHGSFRAFVTFPGQRAGGRARRRARLLLEVERQDSAPAPHLRLQTGQSHLRRPLHDPAHPQRHIRHGLHRPDPEDRRRKRLRDQPLADLLPHLPVPGQSAAASSAPAAPCPSGSPVRSSPSPAEASPSPTASTSAPRSPATAGRADAGDRVASPGVELGVRGNFRKIVVRRSGLDAQAPIEIQA